MKEIFVIKICKKCDCGNSECPCVQTVYASVDGEEGSITESIFNAEKFDTYESAKKMVTEIIDINRTHRGILRMDLMLSIEKHFV